MSTQSSPPMDVKAGRSNAWIWTLVRGLLALALGLFLLFSSQTAPMAIAYALAAYAAVVGAIQTFMSFLNRKAPGSTTDRIRGLVGLIGGGAVLLLAYFNVLSPGASYTLLAVLLILFGGLGIFEVLFDRGDQRFAFVPLLINVLLVALGVMVFYSRSQGFDLRLWAGIIMALIGAGLIAYGYFWQKRNA